MPRAVRPGRGACRRALGGPRAAGLVLLGALVGGCELPQRAFSSSSEYEAYRATRAGYTPEARLEAGRRYLVGYPGGRFVDEVRARFEREEQAFYDLKQGSIAGLEWYLRVLPSGPHAASASLRLADLQQEAARLRGDKLLAQARASERRLSRASSSRKVVTETLVGWISVIASNQAWGRPTWQQPADMIMAMRMEPEAGRCDDLRCLRAQTLVFPVPVVGGGLEERAATFDLGLELRSGGVARASLRGPALFSRLHEASEGKPVQRDELAARAEAVGYAIELIGGAFEAVAPASLCDRGIAPPVLLLRDCGGWKIRVIAGDTPADDDVLEVEGPRGGKP